MTVGPTYQCIRWRSDLPTINSRFLSLQVWKPSIFNTIYSVTGNETIPRMMKHVARYSITHQFGCLDILCWHPTRCLQEKCLTYEISVSLQNPSLLAKGRTRK